MAVDVSGDHTIRPSGGASFAVDDDGRSVDGIKKVITEIDVPSLQQAAASYLSAADRLTSMNEALVSGATAMAKIWEGPSSVESQQSLRTLHATIRELADKFRAVGRPLEALCTRLLAHRDFVEHKGQAWSDNDETWDDSIPGWYRTMNAGYEWGSSDELAGQHLRLLNNDLLKVYEQWPFSIHKVVPDLKEPTAPSPPVETPDDTGGDDIDPDSFTRPDDDFQGDDFDAVDDTSPDDTSTPDLPGDTLSSDGYPDGSTPDGSGTGTDPGGTYPGTGTPGGRDPDGADRAAYPGGGTGPDTGAGLPGTGGLPDTSGSTTLEDFQRPAGWNPNTSTSFPNGNIPPAGNGTGNGVGGTMTGVGALPLNARSASASGSGFPFMPMGGAGAAGEEEEKENSTWLHEDDDVWGNDAGDAVSGKIG
ncbi:WXG100 family type VII secretion target [Nonomuraea spiralis]|uniref:WXG100 family type VII secretion target n=1 Tax=Nonomuraea spiralis TaxID=46182 RepID=A0ABV5IA62_9ACTN|nr:hypothetical protein [Nonomuraea spiralis]GGT04918.1 hypothetical protein GCM10010176_056590 [Nonomuraea spiralis]